MVYISKNAINFNYYEIDEDGNEISSCVDVLSTPLGIVSYLSFNVEIEEGVTIFDMLKFLATNIETADFIFDSSLGGYDFQKFLDELNLNLGESINIDHMAICHDIDEVTEEDMFLFSVPRLRGFNKKGDGFSVEFSPISTYANKTIHLNKRYEIRVMGENGTQSISMIKDFTLFEVFHAILYEMSYHGTSDMRQEALEKMIAKHTEIAGELESLESMQNDLQKHIDNEDYEAAARLRDRIHQMTDRKGTKKD